MNKLTTKNSYTQVSITTELQRYNSQYQKPLYNFSTRPKQEATKYTKQHLKTKKTTPSLLNCSNSAEP